MSLEEKFGQDAGLQNAGCPDSGLMDTGIQDAGLSDTRLQISDHKQQIVRKYKFSFFVVWILAFGISVPGCVSEPSRTYKKEFVNTYAELTLLYENQKMEKKETDSSYQVIVKEFFDRKGIRQEDFKKAAQELSKQPQVWKLFINDVTAAIDSMKNVK